MEYFVTDGKSPEYQEELDEVLRPLPREPMSLRERVEAMGGELRVMG